MTVSGCSSMFNSHLLMPQMFKLTLLTYFVLTIIRHLFIDTKFSLYLFHLIFFCLLFVMAIDGGGVQNDGYNRLEKFIELERKHELDYAKQNPQNYDSMFAIDLEEFKNSEEFRAYLKRQDADVDENEAIFVGWVLLFLSDIALILVHIIRYTGNTIRKKFFKMSVLHDRK